MGVEERMLFRGALLPASVPNDAKNGRGNFIDERIFRSVGLLPIYK